MPHPTLSYVQRPGRVACPAGELKAGDDVYVYDEAGLRTETLRSVEHTPTGPTWRLWTVNRELHVRPDARVLTVTRRVVVGEQWHWDFVWRTLREVSLVPRTDPRKQHVVVLESEPPDQRVPYVRGAERVAHLDVGPHVMSTMADAREARLAHLSAGRFPTPVLEVGGAALFSVRAENNRRTFNERVGLDKVLPAGFTVERVMLAHPVENAPGVRLGVDAPPVIEAVVVQPPVDL